MRGFNSQKNHGYYLGQKFSRTDFTATQNYYQRLQIAHMINQLVEYEISFRKKLHQKDTFGTVWSWQNASDDEFKTNCQLRY
jgi:hypothetical protein